MQVLLTAIQQAARPRLDLCRARRALAPSSLSRPRLGAPIPAEHLDDLHQLGDIGYVRGIEAKLDEIVDTNPAHSAIVAELRRAGAAISS